MTRTTPPRSTAAAAHATPPSLPRTAITAITAMAMAMAMAMAVMMATTTTTMMPGLSFFLLPAATAATTAATTTTNRGTAGPCANGNGEPDDAESLYATHPRLCRFLDLLAEDPDAAAEGMTVDARRRGLLVGDDLPQQQQLRRESPERRIIATATATDGERLPVVLAHGMGDSCFNSGMIRVGNRTSELLGGARVVCVPTGDTQASDTTNGYFLSMDDSVDVFAAKVAGDASLRGGFHAIGFSQGNNVIRGYIARYNNPTVRTFLSINGVNAGESALPGCFPGDGDKPDDEDRNAGGSGTVCDLLLEQASRRAYTEFAQEHSFQANYWRDPRASKLGEYYRYSQLAKWNNEGPGNDNRTLNENYAKTSKFVWVKATRDSMVWPSEGEHWGCPDPTDPFAKPVLPMNETDWYVHDTFGLRTAQEGGKNAFETFAGDHLRFSWDDYDRWVSTYLAVSSSSSEEATSVQ